jgi:uncharacterized protein YbbC (DUF1343 family)
MFDKHQGQICHGVMIHVTDSALFRPVATYVALIALARAQEPEKFEFIVRPYEFETEKCAFDLLTGNSVVREAMLEGRSTNEVVSLMAPVTPEQRPNLSEAEARALRASTT